jgi:hypothetical protein
MTITLGIKQRNLARLSHLLNEVSDPTHAAYGNYMQKEEVEWFQMY